MPEPIRECWRKDVIRILRSCDHRFIEWTYPARQRWEADTFGNAHDHEAYDAMVESLEREDVAGNETTSYTGQLSAYEFFFSHRNRLMYGKIALYEGRLRILILSAHRAQRNTL